MQPEDNIHELTRYKNYLLNTWHTITGHKVVALLVITIIATYGFVQFSNEAMTFSENVKRTFDRPGHTGEIEQTEEPTVEDCRECDDIYQSALKNIHNYQLVSPSDDNAYDKYLELKQLEYHLSDTVLEKIVKKYEILIKADISRGKIGAAKVFLGRLKTVDSSRNYKALEGAIAEAEAETEAKRETKPSVADRATIREDRPGEAQIPDEDRSGEARKHVSLEWIGGVCLAMGSALIDTTKISILESSLKEVDVLASSDLYELFSCANLLVDTSKLNAIQRMADKVATRDLTQNEFGSIIGSLLVDTSKSKAAKILVPLLTKH